MTKPYVRRGFLVGLAIAGAAIALACVLSSISLEIFSVWLLASEDCPSSCKGNLGFHMPMAYGDATAHVPNCQPAEFKLELQADTVKKDMRYPLWYRATLRNSSCFALAYVSADDLINGPQFTVWDSRGVELPRAGRKWNEIIPYSYDRKAFDAMRNDPGLRWSTSEGPNGMEYFSIRMDPGRSVTSLPSMNLPNLNWLQPHGRRMDFSTEDEAMRRIIERRLAGKKLEPSPSGYAVIEGYSFKQPGRYRIRAQFWSSFYPKFRYPRYEWYSRHVPAIVQRKVSWLTDLLIGRDLRPWTQPGTIYELKVDSNSVEFEVVP